MKMTYCQSNRKRIELCPCFRKLPGFAQMHKELATSNKFHYEKYLLFGLENVLHTHQKGVIGFLQYFFFKQSRLNLVVIYYDILS